MGNKFALNAKLLPTWRVKTGVKSGVIPHFALERFQKVGAFAVGGEVKTGGLGIFLECVLYSKSQSN